MDTNVTHTHPPWGLLGLDYYKEGKWLGMVQEGDT